MTHFIRSNLDKRDRFDLETVQKRVFRFSSNSDRSGDLVPLLHRLRVAGHRRARHRRQADLRQPGGVPGFHNVCMLQKGLLKFLCKIL